MRNCNNRGIRQWLLAGVTLFVLVSFACAAFADGVWRGPGSPRKSVGTVVAWGDNLFGQSTVPSGLSDVVAISGGDKHSLALKSDGTVVAWGSNFYGQTDVPANLHNVVAISAGGYHNLALKSDGTVVAWGANYSGQTDVPANLHNVVAISAGNAHSVALKSDGTVVAWGADFYGQSTVPSGLSDVVAISAGAAHSLALKADGTVVAWGAYYSGQTDVPSGLKNVVAISAGAAHSLALKADGTVVAWGAYYSGQTDVPSGLKNVVAISAGAVHSVALKADGTVAAWRDDGFGQTDVPSGLKNVVAISAGVAHSLALKSNESHTTAWGADGSGQTDVPSGLKNVVAISAGAEYSLALKPDGTVVAWGADGTGQTDVPSGLKNVVAISAGGFHNLALKADGTVVAWGDNRYGQTDVPSGLSDVVAISAGAYHSVALKSDGTVVAWGADGSGQTNVPADLHNVVAISAGAEYSLALKSDGTVVAWGADGTGQTDVPSGLKNVVAISAGAFHNLALKADGTVVAWGDNVFDQTDVPANLHNVVAISAGAFHNLAISALQPPVANAGADFSVTVSHDGNPNTKNASVTLDGSASYDPNNESLTYQWTQGPAILGTAPTITVTGVPPGTYAFTLTVTNTDGLRDADSVTVTVLAETNQPPVANNQSVTTNQDTSVAITLTGSDPEGDPITYQVTPPLHGTLAGTAPNLRYTPNAGYVGFDVLTFLVTDSYGASATATVSITVAKVNHAPTANPQSVVTNEDIPVAITLTGSDPDNDRLTYTVATQPAHGTLSGTAPNLTYTPTANYNGPDSFYFKANDGTADSNIATVSLTIKPVNDPPVLTVPGSVNGVAGKPVTFTATATDPDLPGDTLTFSLVSPPAGASINATTGAVSFTTAVAGTYSLTVKVTDAAGASDTKTVSIVIGSDPNGSVKVLMADVSVMRVNAATVKVTFNLLNSGTGQANAVKVISGKLRTVNATAPLPGPFTIPAGNRQSVTLTFTSSSGIASGTAAFSMSGSYTGGTFSSGLNVTVP